MRLCFIKLDGSLIRSYRVVVSFLDKALNSCDVVVLFYCEFSYTDSLCEHSLPVKQKTVPNRTSIKIRAVSFARFGFVKTLAIFSLNPTTIYNHNVRVNESGYSHSHFILNVSLLERMPLAKSNSHMSRDMQRLWHSRAHCLHLSARYVGLLYVMQAYNSVLFRMTCSCSR